MGILEFSCMTTDPAATTFYGLTNADHYQLTGTGGWPKNVVLVKSNTNPSSVKTTNWSFLSSYSSENLSLKNGFFSTAGCAVDSRGVVTFIAADLVFNTTKPYSEFITALRYDPTGVSDPAMSQGTGSWSTLTLNPAFGQVSIEKLSLWYSTVAGVETLNLAQPTLSVYSLKNVGTNAPALLKTYLTPACSYPGAATKLTILQDTLYMICISEFDGPLTTMAVLKDVSNANSKFNTSVCLTTAIKRTDFFVAITAAGGQPFALMQQYEGYHATLQYSLALAGPSFATFEGGTRAAIPENFGYDPALAKPQTAAPVPTNDGRACGEPKRGRGGSSGGGSSGSSGGGHSTGKDIAAVAAALPLKILIPIVAAALFIGIGIIYGLVKCCQGCYMVSKDIVNGEVPSGVVAINDLAVPTRKEEEVVGTGVGDLAYPVMREDHPTSTYSPYGTPLSPPTEQDNGLGYLFTDASSNATQQSTPLTTHEAAAAAPLTSAFGNPPSPTILRHSRPDM
ncbi:hypothetical protein BGZ96_012531 [Linnemannia gamsii]|uniref:Uncharacterized protein n=1 Tax=Linnemannia gamsii TaxID=64522 RepID=A0ABQ7JQS2_9FUNG|nr:hypothetical protein BGZ96_012531 [Linnemannia gamsii]